MIVESRVGLEFCSESSSECFVEGSTYKINVEL